MFNLKAQRTRLQEDTDNYLTRVQAISEDLSEAIARDYNAEYYRKRDELLLNINELESVLAELRKRENERLARMSSMI